LNFFSRDTRVEKAESTIEFLHIGGLEEQMLVTQDAGRFISTHCRV